VTAPYRLQRNKGTWGFCTNNAGYVRSDAASGVTGANSTGSKSNEKVTLLYCQLMFPSTCVLLRVPGLPGSARVSVNTILVVPVAGSGHLDGKVTHTKTAIPAIRPADDGRSEHGTPRIYHTKVLSAIPHMSGVGLFRAGLMLSGTDAHLRYSVTQKQNRSAVFRLAVFLRHAQ